MVMGMSLYIDREHIDTGCEEAPAQNDHHYCNDKDIGEMVTMVLMKPSKIPMHHAFVKSTQQKCKDQSELWEEEFKAFMALMNISCCNLEARCWKTALWQLI